MLPVDIGGIFLIQNKADFFVKLCTVPEVSVEISKCWICVATGQQQQRRRHSFLAQILWDTLDVNVIVHVDGFREFSYHFLFVNVREHLQMIM